MNEDDGEEGPHGCGAEILLEELAEELADLDRRLLRAVHAADDERALVGLPWLKIDSGC